MQPRKIIFNVAIPELTNVRKVEDAKKNSLFMSESESARYCLYVNKEEKLCFEDGIPLESKLQTKTKVKQNPFKFIINLTGEIIAAPKYDSSGNKISGPSIDEKFSPSIKHSTLCQGSKVLFAGAMYFKDGKIIKITHESGHYLPDIYAFHQVLRFFEKAHFMSATDAQIGRCLPLVSRKEPTFFWVRGIAAFEKRFEVLEHKLEIGVKHS